MNDIEAMARTLYGEARGEPREGKIAVAHVILNRSQKPLWWSRGVKGVDDFTIAAVCLKPYQFSCWNKEDPNRFKILQVTTASRAFRECLEVTAAVMGGFEKDPTGGADHYHTDAVAPAWIAGQTPIAIIGAHLFYKLH